MNQAVGPGLRGKRVELRLRSCHDDEPCALAREDVRDCTADPLTGTRDDDDLAAEVEIHGARQSSRSQSNSRSAAGCDLLDSPRCPRATHQRTAVVQSASGGITIDRSRTRENANDRGPYMASGDTKSPSSRRDVCRPSEWWPSVAATLQSNRGARLAISAFVECGTARPDRRSFERSSLPST